MAEKYGNMAIVAAILLLFMTMLMGCSSQTAAPQAPATVPAETQPATIAPGEPSPAAEPNIPSSEGMPSVPTGSPQATNTPPSTGTPSSNGGVQPSTTPSTEPQQLTVAVPEDMSAGTARFVVKIPDNTPTGSKVYLEAYDIKYGTWRAYEMSNEESLVGWNIVIYLGTSGGVDTSDNTFHYRYSRAGNYATAEKFAIDSSGAYRTRAVSDISGQYVQDQVIEWRG